MERLGAAKGGAHQLHAPARATAAGTADQLHPKGGRPGDHGRADDVSEDDSQFQLIKCDYEITQIYLCKQLFPVTLIPGYFQVHDLD